MPAQIVSFHCVMKNKLGQVLGSSFNADVINQLENGHETLAGLVAGLQDLTNGEKRKISVPADQGYGLYNPKLVLEVPRSEIPSPSRLKVGDEIQKAVGKDGRNASFRVVSAEKDSVTLDGNHPLAGQDLIFEIEVISARTAVKADFAVVSSDPEAKTLH